MMPTKETIIKIVEEQETTFVHTENPKEPVIDKLALGRLLMNKPQAKGEPVHLVKVRCYRSADSWGIWGHGRCSHHFSCAILVNASLSSKELPAIGCGGSDWVGMASGDMVFKGEPVTVPSKNVRRLIFDRDEGGFFDAETGQQITKADYLILKENCHAEYIRA